MNELDNLTAITTNSRRGGGTNYDLRHVAENNEFHVSETLYADLDLNNNGFIAHVGNGNIYLSVQPNEDSVSYKGGRGDKKGLKFASTNLSELFTRMDLPENLSLVEVGEKNGSTFYRVEPVVVDEDIDEIASVEEPVNETTNTFGE